MSCEHNEAANKWVVENYNANDQKEPVVVKPSSKESVYIGTSKGNAGGQVVFKVEGKSKSITLMGLENCAVVVDECISTIEIVRCKKLQFQINGPVPTLNIDSSERVTAYVNEKHAANALVITAKSDSINVVVLPEAEDADATECPLPEQIEHRWDAEKKEIISTAKLHKEGN